MKWLLPTLWLIATPVAALDFSLANAISVRTEIDPAGSVRLPEAPWSPGTVPPLAEGTIRREVLRFEGGQRTTLQLLATLRDRLAANGYEEVFTCADAACGGFDFRFQLDIIGEPDMHVDLGDYRYVLARNPAAEPHLVALLASRSQSAGFVHITTVSEATIPEAPSEPPAVSEEPPAPKPAGDLVSTLTEAGHAVLDGLDFGSGTSELNGGPYPSLAALADWLASNPSARIALVGHTDSVGSLQANTALSRQRAASVARYLVNELGADSTRIQSSGAGYLAPIASNLTEEGRARNRRVEVVLLSLE